MRGAFVRPDFADQSNPLQLGGGKLSKYFVQNLKLLNVKLVRVPNDRMGYNLAKVTVLVDLPQV